MRRKIAMIALLGGLAAGLGCHHIAGKGDCGYDPAAYPIGPPTQPYPTYAVTGDPTPIKDKDTKANPIPKKPGSDMDPKKTGND